MLATQMGYGQGRRRNKKLTKGDTYAVIVGISKYADGDLPNLEYAHRDAEAFNNFLRSKAG